MAMVLLAIAAAGILMPIAAAAAAQAEAQRRVVATRMAADVIEMITAKNYAEIIPPGDYTLTYTSTGENLKNLGYPETYQNYQCNIKTNYEYINKDAPNEIKLIFLVVKVFDGNRPVTELKTLVGKDHL